MVLVTGDKAGKPAVLGVVADVADVADLWGHAGRPVADTELPL